MLAVWGSRARLRVRLKQGRGMRALSGLRMLGKKEEATSTGTARVYLNLAPLQRLRGGILAMKGPRDLIPVLAPDGPAPSRGTHCGSGGEGLEMGKGLGAASLPLPLPGQAVFVPCGGGGGGQTPVRLQG